VAGGEVLLGVLVLLANAPLAAHVLSRAAYRARGKPQYGRLDDALQQKRDKD
jgi:multicomponent Na+:H+ antiporter subunit G